MKDSFRLVLDVLEPLFAIIVGSPESMTRDVLVDGKLSQSALQLAEGEVEGVVLYILPRVLESIKKELGFAEIAVPVRSVARQDVVGLTRFQAR